MEDKSKVALYIRVSTERQANEGDSLEEQENELRKFCDYRKYQIHNCYIERGKSGGNTNRPEYQKLIKDIEKQKISAVVVKKLDRLSRSLLDFENLMKLMQQKNVEFISLKENFDTTNAMGKAMLRVALVFAQLEREQTSERIKDVFAFRAEQGLYNGGSRALGYISVDTELTPYKKEREIIEIIYNRFLETKSSTAVARFLNDAGYKDQNKNFFSNRQIDNILRNPIYTGKIQWKGNLYQGIHQAIISEKKFDQVREILKERRFISPRNQSKAMLQKLIFCGECGSPMTTAYAYNPSKIKYYYYRCTESHQPLEKRKRCKNKYLPLPKIEKLVFNIFLSLSEEQSFKLLENKILKYNQKIETEIQKTEKTIIQLEGKLELTKEKKDNYLDTLISSQFLSKERELISQKTKELEMEEKQLKLQLDKLHFKQSQEKEEIIDITIIKKSIVTFRIENEGYSETQLKGFYTHSIEKITYHPDKLVMQFKFIPWKETFIID